MPVIASPVLTRRQLVGGIAMLSALVLVEAGGGASLIGAAQAAAPDPQTDAVRRLMTASSRHALDRLSRPGGFWNSPVARIPLPVLFKPLGTRPAPVGSAAFGEALQHTLNTLAEKGAARAVPVTTRGAARVRIAQPAAVIAGDPTAATTLLRQATGARLVNAMIPALREALRNAADPQVGQAMRALKGVDAGDVAKALAIGADNAIWYQIGAEEAAIRRDPATAGDPVLTAALRG